MDVKPAVDFYFVSSEVSSGVLVQKTLGGTVFLAPANAGDTIVADELSDDNFELALDGLVEFSAGLRRLPLGESLYGYVQPDFMPSEQEHDRWLAGVGWIHFLRTDDEVSTYPVL